jgi:gas vesicle protein
MKTAKVMLGMLAGAAAGALAGVLMAPDKGSATRESLKRKGSGALDDVKGKFNSLVETVSEKFSSDHSAPAELRRVGKPREHTNQPRQQG